MANFTAFNFSEKFDLPNNNLILADLTDYISNGYTNVVGIDFAVWIGGVDTGIEVYSNTSWTTPDIIVNPQPSNTKTIGLPQFAGQVQWGVYTVVGTLKENDGTLTTLTKTFELCKPKSCGCNGVVNGSCAEPSVRFDCNRSTMYVWDTTTFAYKGITGTPVYSLTINFPLGCGVSPITVAVPTYSSSPIINGLYNIRINDTATYSFDNNISVIIAYTCSVDKAAQCDVSLCNLECAFDSYLEEYEKVKGSGSQRERTIQQNMVELLALMQKARLQIECGNDVSETIKEIKDITGKDCGCGNCGSTVPPIPIPSLYNVIVEADSCNGDIVVTPIQSGNNYYFKVKDKHYDIKFADGQTGATVTYTDVNCTRTFELEICPMELSLCGSVVVNSISGSPNWENTTDTITVGSPLSEVFDSIEASLVNIGTFINAYLNNPPTWIGLAFNSSGGTTWGNLGASFQTGQYSKDAHTGRVQLRGTVAGSGTNPTTPHVIATLPTGFRPSAVVIFNPEIQLLGTALSGYYVTINTTGTISFTSPSPATPAGSPIVSLDGIYFYIN